MKPMQRTKDQGWASIAIGVVLLAASCIWIQDRAWLIVAVFCAGSWFGTGRAFLGFAQGVEQTVSAIRVGARLRRRRTTRL